ncbi:hypothetical protein CLCR_05109 [Cladophialophora carrionii]|uniref:Putative transcription factor kapC n=1 Tax=Cladophialophora carrionii TaxID=86049 RepID=A0A1C1CLG9_9EURO|nr:hypothetical protein CLCR_05109 [Cladophialophora carrionii]
MTSQHEQLQPSNTNLATALSTPMDWTILDGLLAQDGLQYTKTASAWSQSGSETAAIAGLEDGVLGGAGDDALSSQRRRKARMSEVDEATQLRRRAQNRESQQAYRQRKEEYILRLQDQILALHLRHRDLWQSYLAQGRRVGLLKEVVADLASEIAILRERQGRGGLLAPSHEKLLLQPGQECILTASGPSVPQQTNSRANIVPATMFITSGLQGPVTLP